MRVRRGSGDSGSISIFVALSVSVMLLFIGVVFDCGGALRTLANVDALAQEAARVGGQQIDQGQLLSGNGLLINTTAAYAAANAYLAPYGLTAQPPDGHPEPMPLYESSFTVVIKSTYRTALLGLINVPTLDVRGQGTANLVSDVTKAGTP